MKRRVMSAVALGLLLLVPVAVRGEDTKAMVRLDMEEGVNTGNLAVVDELIAAAYVGHTPFASELKGRRVSNKTSPGPVLSFRIALSGSRI
jgi:hypothetical protein